MYGCNNRATDFLGEALQGLQYDRRRIPLAGLGDSDWSEWSTVTFRYREGARSHDPSTEEATREFFFHSIRPRMIADIVRVRG